MIKPSSGSCGQGIEKILVKDHDPSELYERLSKEKRCLIEEVATQIDEIGKLHPNSINTLSTTCDDRLSFLRIHFIHFEQLVIHIPRLRSRLKSMK